MRRSICYCEPSAALAGAAATWKFVYTTASHLPKGAKLRFEMGSKGRPLEWQVPQINLKEKSNLIWAELSEGKPLAATQTDTDPVAFEFTLPQELKPGENFTICIGSPTQDATKGNTCQKTVQRKRPFTLLIDPKGKGDYKESETFYLDVRGSQLKTLRVIAPSLVSRNKRFDVIVRFEDIYGNLTSNAADGTLIELSYQNLRENLSWKLFVPETGFIALPNLYFNEPGIYRIQLKNLQTKEQFQSPPIKCLPEGSLSLFWGCLHSESDRAGAEDHPETYLRHMRDDKALQFFASSGFESEEETSNDAWKALSAQTAEFNEDDRFIAMLGFQWQGENKEEGLRQFIYSKDAKQVLRRKDTKNNSLKKIYKTNNPKELISIPCLTMGKTTCYNFADFNAEFERVVEIYNAWGSSECTEKEGNLRSIHGRGSSETADGSIRKALNNGCRFGFIAGGSDARGAYQPLAKADKQTHYTPGLTAILAKEQNRNSLMEALQARSCYATTGERIILGIHIAGFGMGSELDTKSRPGLEYNRHITGYAIGTKPLSEVILIRNGKEFKRFTAKEDRFEFELDDMELLGTVALETRTDHPPFVYYYLRVQQQDGHIAWSSPIWVDLNSKTATPIAAKKPKKRVGE